MDKASENLGGPWPAPHVLQPIAFEFDGLPGLVDEVAARRRRRLGWALALSVAIHLLAFSIKLATPSGQSSQGGRQQGHAPIAMRLQKQKQKPPALKAVQPPVLPRPSTKPNRTPPRLPHSISTAPRVMTAPPSAVKTWSRAQSDDVDQFMNDLATEPKHPAAPQPTLSQQALAMAHNLGTAEEMANEREEAQQQHSPPATAQQRFSFEMYFEALYRKLNSSAKMVGPGKIEHGRNIAAVSVTLNHDGTVKTFKVLYAADQAETISYIKSVFDRAAPFSPFPPDIRSGADTLTMQICIIPSHLADGGAMFSPIKGKGCRG